MPIEDDIDAFREWATQLGCAQTALPSKDALKSVFKSRQRDLFCNLMRRVKPRNECQSIREKILINELEKLNDLVIPVSKGAFLPKAMQIHLKVQDLKKQQKDLQKFVEDRKKEYEGLSSNIKAKNIQIIKFESRCEILEAKILILEFKSQDLDVKLKTEEENRKKILSTIPVVLTSENKSEAKAAEAVNEAIRKLKQFYEFCVENKSSQQLSEAKSKLWSDMRQIYSRVPNFMLFNAIMRLKEEQLQDITNLSKTVNNDSHLMLLSKEDCSEFEFNLLRTKVNLLGLSVKYLVARQERQQLDSQFLRLYCEFEPKLLEKVKMFNTHVEDEKTEETLREYIVQYNARIFIKGQNESLLQHIDSLKAEIDSTTRDVEHHEILLGSVKDIYNRISISVNRIRYEMSQLSQIKDRIIYSKGLMEHQLHSLQPAMRAKSRIKVNNINDNQNFLQLSDIFETSPDEVFCSTKLDFDDNASALNNTTFSQRSFYNSDVTLMPQAQPITLPPHTMELSTFAELPLERLNCVPKECLFLLSPNPLIIETRELTSTIQLAPGILLTPFGALQEVRKHIMWAELIAAHSNSIKLNSDICIVDISALKLKAKQEHDRIAELLDKIHDTTNNTMHQLERLNKLYDFIIANPLRHFIPITKKFNNQSYCEYEAEFELYYRMATAGNSIKE
ncbi:augmin complex subunit dgt5 [Glossina fuscipes]|uniref:Augmin complex subunit dgt5 n=1 Tax=Glossina fuscipes TaxID=7396 RepID=A0A9C6DSP6_9MUSC|nr:augmin complex subunit dgt5 [Glossina fuscipes]